LVVDGQINPILKQVLMAEMRENNSLTMYALLEKILLLAIIFELVQGRWGKNAHLLVWRPE